MYLLCRNAGNNSNNGVDSETGYVVDMYECQCGVRTWGDRVKVAAEEIA
jgi:hypothetical protein